MVATIATIDLKRIHKNYFFVREVYPEYSEGYLYFLAICVPLDPNIDLDAAGFVDEFSKKGPGNSYVLPCPVTNQYLGQVTCLAFCLYVKTFKGRLFSLLECWNHKQLFSTLKVFEIYGFTVKELAVATENFIDIISSLTPNSYRTLSSSDQKSYQWVSKILQGLLWEWGEYPYCYLQQILYSNILRYPLAVFYAKGKEKTSTLTELLQNNVINLETLSCPKIEHLKLYWETPICNILALSSSKRQRSKHCAKKKALLFYHWLMNESTLKVFEIYGFTVKELAVATENFIDIISSLTPNSYRTLSSSDQKSYQWVSKILQGLLWETGEYPYCYLQQILYSIILRFPLAVFYAKGKGKTSTLTELLQKNVINFETLSSPRIENLKLYWETPICNILALSSSKRQRSRHCAKKKALLFDHWLMNESTLKVFEIYGFTVKELAVATENFIDIISSLTPNSYRTLSSSDQKSYQWVSKILQGLLWETGEYPYCYLQQILYSIILRFPLAVFYAKGKGKTSTLTELLQKNVINLETLSSLKIEHLKLYWETPICNILALRFPKRRRSRHCAKKKALLFYHWLMNESTSREDKSLAASGEFVSKFDSLQLRSAWQSIDSNSSEGGKNWLPWTNNSQKAAYCVWWRWNRSF